MSLSSAVRASLGTFDGDFTESEIEVVADYPLRAPQLLRIKDKAEDTSEAAAKSNSLVPEDAYRHILWSFLLTKEYGGDFARRVTDAHEVPENDTRALADFTMDIANNAVGRRYAKIGIPENSILTTLMNDSDVVQSVDDVEFDTPLE